MQKCFAWSLSTFREECNKITVSWVKVGALFCLVFNSFLNSVISQSPSCISIRPERHDWNNIAQRSIFLLLWECVFSPLELLGSTRALVCLGGCRVQSLCFLTRSCSLFLSTSGLFLKKIPDCWKTFHN